jgi:transcriptional regulator with GAF, ATPase, and Fis domain
MKRKKENLQDEKLKHIQRFRNAMHELSERLVSVPAKLIEKEIAHGLQRIAESWGFEHIILTELTADKKGITILDSYSSSDLKTSPFTISTDRIPWLVKRLSLSKAVCLDNVPRDLPALVDEDRRFFLANGVKSLAMLPLNVGDSFRGGLFIALVQKKIVWTDILIKDLSCLAVLLAGALMRSKNAERIDDILGFEQLLFETSAKYINLPAEEVDKMMKRDLGRLGQLMGVNRCIIYLLNEEQNTFRPLLHSGWWPEEDDELVRSLNHLWSSDSEFAEQFQYLFDAWRRGEWVQWTKSDRTDDMSPGMVRVIRAYVKLGVQSQLSVPISVGGSTMGALSIADTRYGRKFSESLIPRICLFGEIFGNAFKRKQSEEALKNSFSEISKLKKRIEADYIYLREEIKLEHNFEEIIGQSVALKQVLVQAEQVAPTEATVLICGETGTGKELVARAVHNASTRRDRPLIKVNCATLTPSLIESELFGHEKGAFTGAVARRAGRFELADGATLFLDEIGELPLELQPKLLRVLQDGEFERVGGQRTLRTDVRIIAATNRSLPQEVEEGRFRRDLWYRLNTFPLQLPPLRERLDDIPSFVEWFVGKFGKKIGKRFDRIPRKAVSSLKRYHWPGNVRELENIVERAVITSHPGHFQIEVPPHAEKRSGDIRTLKQCEREFITEALSESDWIIEGPYGAALRLGLKPSTLRYRMKILNINRPTSKRRS